MLEIFLDMDGVLADLRRHMHACWFHQDGRPFVESPETRSWYAKPERWTTGPVLNPEFWETIPQYPWAQALYIRARQLGKVHICSNPGRPQFARSAAYGKMAWCEAQLGIKPPNVILICHKYLLARKDRVLIDDDEDNIDAWNKAGGMGILFPQPWNDNSYLVSDDPISYCVKEIERRVSLQ